MTAKTIFRQYTYFNKPKLKSLLDSKRGWFPKKLFKELVEREKHRSNRSGSMLSYIVLDLSAISNNGKLDEKTYLLFGEGILDTISKFTRIEDIKCLSKQNEIGILLVDTEISAAELFVEKLGKKLLDLFQADRRTSIFTFIRSIKIFTYPTETPDKPGDFDLAGADSTLSSVLPDSQPVDDTSHKMISTQLETRHIPEFSLNLTSFSNGVMVLQDPFIWHLPMEAIKEKLILLTKRGLDICGALFGLTLFLPVMALIALVIKATSKGPVLFRQNRVGKGGKEFAFLKFRSMRIDCDDAIHRDYTRKLIQGQNEAVNLGDTKKPCYKIKKDPRITRIGHFLRNTSLDELPQFYNVLKGEMSLVGPRPPIPYEVKYYQCWHLQRVFKAKPGITGLWQLYGRSVCTFDDMVRYDLQYIDQLSPWLDIKIMFKTLFVFLRQNGAL